MCSFDLNFSFSICLLGITVAIATVYDLWKGDHSESFAIQSLLCFSAKKNCKILFSTEDSKDSSISCIHGIRVLSTCWIVLIHVGGAFALTKLIYNRQIVFEVILLTG